MFTVTLITVKNTKFSFQIIQLILILLNTSFLSSLSKVIFQSTSNNSAADLPRNKNVCNLHELLKLLSVFPTSYPKGRNTNFQNSEEQCTIHINIPLSRLWKFLVLGSGIWMCSNSGNIKVAGISISAANPVNIVTYIRGVSGK